MVLGVRLVCPAAAVCISSVLPTRGTLQYVGDQHTLADCCGTAELEIPFFPKFSEIILIYKIKSFPKLFPTV